MPLIIIRGAGDIASGIALRLHRSGYSIIMTDLPAPTSIRRTVCFSEALRLGLCTVAVSYPHLRGTRPLMVSSTMKRCLVVVGFRSAISASMI